MFSIDVFGVMAGHLHNLNKTVELMYAAVILRSFSTFLLRLDMLTHALTVYDVGNDFGASNRVHGRNSRSA
jgi:hypothetical protein